MNIVYASDDNFAEILGISLVSLFENNKESDEINVYIIDDNIKEENKVRIKDIADKYNRNTVFVHMPDINAVANIEIKSQRWSISAFSRLFLPSLISANIDKIIYIDCDTLILKSLNELWNINLKIYYCAGVTDCISNNHKSNIGLNPTDNYFNSGVLLISLDNWRKDNMQNKFIDFIQKYNGKVPYVDQGVINGTMGDMIMVLPPIYNSTTVGFDFQPYKKLLKYRKPSNYYSKEEVKESIESPVIVHFTTSFLSLRPWVKGCKHLYASKWLEYKAISPWADTPLRKDGRSGKKKMLVIIYRFLPKLLAVSFAGWLHAVVVPWCQGKKLRG